MKTKAEAEREAAEIAGWRKTALKTTKCSYCAGSGRKYAPLHGDPALGYSEVGPCDYCIGSGQDRTKLKLDM